MYMVDSNDASYAQRLATASAVKAAVRDPAITLHQPVISHLPNSRTESSTIGVPDPVQRHP